PGMMRKRGTPAGPRPAHIPWLADPVSVPGEGRGEFRSAGPTIARPQEESQSMYEFCNLSVTNQPEFRENLSPRPGGAPRHPAAGAQKKTARCSAPGPRSAGGD